MVEYSKIFDKEGISYTSYREFIDEQFALGKTTGADADNADYINYAKMNLQRMKRLDKTVTLNSELEQALAELHGKYNVLVVTEGWCGDAAQIVPVINKFAVASPDNLMLKLVFRDAQDELMNAHLTNGGRAIPVILIIDAENGGLLAKWGPRPAILQNLLSQWKANGLDFAVVAEQLHGWYAKDKTQTIQEEFIRIIKGLEIKS